MTHKDRISVTLPPDLVAAADRRAEQLDRSRSWVVAEALRHYLALRGPRRVLEPEAEYSPAPTGDASAEVAAARRQQLEASLRLSPGERLERAGALASLAPRRASNRQQIIGFESYDDFYEWKLHRRAEG